MRRRWAGHGDGARTAVLTAANPARLVAVVAGRVQGVGLRAWVRSHARARGLAGSARNLPDGRVEVVAEGPRPACDQLLAALRHDAPGRVDDVAVRWEAPTGAADGFSVG